MTLSELYPLARTAHISLVIISGALFAVRGVAVLLGARWAMVPPLRRLSYTIDTGLLSAALLLLVILNLNPFAVPWLATKIALLLTYIVLGSLALKRARTPRLRLVSLAAAFVCYGMMLSIALAHHPLGLLARLQSIPA